jgi:hypothetical protein
MVVTPSIKQPPQRRKKVPDSAPSFPSIHDLALALAHMHPMYITTSCLHHPSTSLAPTSLQKGSGSTENCNSLLSFPMVVPLPSVSLRCAAHRAVLVCVGVWPVSMQTTASIMGKSGDCVPSGEEKSALPRLYHGLMDQIGKYRPVSDACRMDTLSGHNVAISTYRQDIARMDEVKGSERETPFCFPGWGIVGRAPPSCIKITESESESND